MKINLNFAYEKKIILFFDEHATMLRFCLFVLFLFSLHQNILALKNCTRIHNDLWTKELAVEFDDVRDLNRYFYIFDRYCNQSAVSHENCNLRENIEVKHGYAFMKAKYKKYGQYNFSAAQMDTLKYYSYGRYEIRARLSRGDYLQPSAFFRTNASYKATGQVNIFSYLQRDYLHRGVYFKNLSSPYLRADLKFDTPVHAAVHLGARFHIYGIEWERDRLRFFLDDNYTVWHDFGPKRNITPWHIVRFQLGVGGREYSNGVPTDFSSLNWICPALILDYVRIYYSVKDPKECETISEVVDHRDEYYETDRIDSSCLTYSKDYEYDYMNELSENGKKIAAASSAGYLQIRSKFVCLCCTKSPRILMFLFTFYYQHNTSSI